MSSIIKRPGFSDRYERSRRQHAIAYQDFGRDGQGLYLQSADLNEMQSRALDHTRRGLDYILQDSRIMDGQYPVVEEADEDHIRVHLPACPIYIAGIVHDVDLLIIPRHPYMNLKRRPRRTATTSSRV
ncbi:MULTISPECIES: DUF4815 domain-containing protein [unclassified Brucella]|uniref:DUF4815 domain-containing protein n=1 Tax=unclassified Brucella TaxID=2632610 RepID=UPI000B0815D6|nr:MULTISPECIES: DUF4815 domain-containing protein [unclassified Brucella]